MGELEQIIEQAILKHSRRLVIKQVIAGVARNVGETACEVERENSPVLYNVRLNAIDDSLDSCFTVYPAEGSAVLVAIIENLKTEAVVISCSEVQHVKIKTGNMSLVMNSDGLVFNDGASGLVKITNLVAWMQKVYTDLQTLKTLLAAVPLTFVPVTPNAVQADFEDVKVKH